MAQDGVIGSQQHFDGAMICMTLTLKGDISIALKWGESWLCTQTSLSCRR